MTAERRRPARRCREAGELLAVEAIDRTGLMVTSEGAFVRILRVTPPNPLILSAEDRATIAAGFWRLVAQLRAGAVAAVLRRRAPGQPRRAAGRRAGARCRPAPGRRRRRAAARATRRRCRAGGCTRRWRSRCAGTPTSRPRSQLSAYVVVPYLPRQRAARAALAWAAAQPAARGAARARRCRRTGARCASSQAHVDALRAELEALRAAHATSSTASRCSRCCGRGFNPTKADSGRRPPGARRRGARRARRRPRPRAGARAPRCALRRADRRARAWTSRATRTSTSRSTATSSRSIYAHTTAQQTPMGWLHGAMLTRQPYTLSVLRARARPPPRAPEAQARLPAAVRDQPRRRAARPRARLRPLRAGARVRAAARRDGRPRPRQRVPRSRSTRRSARAARTRTWPRSPRPSTTASSRSSRVGDCKVNRGEFRQHELWPSSAAARPRRRRAARASTPTAQRRRHGPAGRHRVRLADRDPVRVRRPRAARVERLDPYDPEHANHTLLICGTQRLGQDDDRQRAPRRAASRTARARS